MQLFFFVHSDAPLLPANGSLALRIAFLFADTAIASPASLFMVDIEHAMADRRLAVKLPLVLDNLKKWEPEQAKQLEASATQIKKIRAQKRLNQTAIVLIRQFERLVDDYFKSYIADMKEGLGRFGYTELRPLINDPGFMHYDICDTNPETAEEGYTPTSRIVQLLGDEGDRRDGGVKDITFILPVETFMQSDAVSGIYSLADAFAGDSPVAEDASVIWAEPLLRLPNVNSLTGTELKAIRDQMREPGAPFRTAMNAWIFDCLQERNGSRERARYFVEVVKPAADALQEATQRNKLLAATRLAENNGKDTMWIYAAEMPLREIWSINERLGNLKEPTMQALRDAWETRGKLRVPVIIIALPKSLEQILAENKDEADTPEDAETAPESVRKSISL